MLVKSVGIRIDHNLLLIASVKTSMAFYSASPPASNMSFYNCWGSKSTDVS